MSNKMHFLSGVFKCHCGGQKEEKKKSCIMAITTSVKDNDGQQLCALRWSSHRLSPSQMFRVFFFLLFQESAQTNEQKNQYIP